MSETYEKDLAGANVAELGLVWDEASRRLCDPETGEVFSLERVVDEATAKAATFRIWSTEASIANLKEQKRAIDRQIKDRERRLAKFRELYLEDLSAVAEKLMENARSRLQSIRIGYGVVGYQRRRPSVAVRDEEKAAVHALKCAPRSVKATIDLSDIPPESLPAWATLLGLTMKTAGRDALKLEVRPSMIPPELQAALPSDAFAVEAGGQLDWYAKGGKAKEGGDGE